MNLTLKDLLVDLDERDGEPMRRAVWALLGRGRSGVKELARRLDGPRRAAITAELQQNPLRLAESLISLPVEAWEAIAAPLLQLVPPAELAARARALVQRGEPDKAAHLARLLDERADAGGGESVTLAVVWAELGDWDAAVATLTEAGRTDRAATVRHGSEMLTRAVLDGPEGTFATVWQALAEVNLGGETAAVAELAAATLQRAAAASEIGGQKRLAAALEQVRKLHEQFVLGCRALLRRPDDSQVPKALAQAAATVRAQVGRTQAWLEGLASQPPAIAELVAAAAGQEAPDLWQRAATGAEPAWRVLEEALQRQAAGVVAQHAEVLGRGFGALGRHLEALLAGARLSADPAQTGEALTGLQAELEQLAATVQVVAGYAQLLDEPGQGSTLDSVRWLEEALRQVTPVLAEREVRVERRLPGAGVAARGRPGPLSWALAALLLSAGSAVVRGGAVRLDLDQSAARVSAWVEAGNAWRQALTGAAAPWLLEVVQAVAAAAGAETEVTATEAGVRVGLHLVCDDPGAALEEAISGFARLGAETRQALVAAHALAAQSTEAAQRDAVVFLLLRALGGELKSRLWPRIERHKLLPVALALVHKREAAPYTEMLQAIGRDRMNRLVDDLRTLSLVIELFGSRHKVAGVSIDDPLGLSELGAEWRQSLCQNLQALGSLKREGLSAAEVAGVQQQVWQTLDLLLALPEG